ncbi:hypothetical protein GCM10023143_22020 [Compostibacter hankyongensis]|uniref:Methane oxygenase PmoA n=2 Tax=Compostibacter hankyongensis TaxID=1007089 RepID=A0ABP8FWE2_9BACT
MLFLPAVSFVSCNNPPSQQADEEKNPGPQGGPKVELVDNKEAQQVDVLVDGKPFTSYCYSDTLLKQILYPIYTAGGHFLTRGWPLKSRPGEHTDHPHQRGMWLNYGDVNGYDFWGNSYAIPQDVRKVQKGTIKHVKIDRIASGNGEGTLVADERWVSPYGHPLLAEQTTYHFLADGTTRIIDRITTLTATDSAVAFKDTKEGMFAIRYNRHLHIPSNKPETFVDAEGNKTTVTPDSREATGNYLSSEAVTGDSVWSTRAKWMDLYGNIEGEDISVVICDHPRNFDYPTYWHARGYGLFSANPFGAHDFTNGKLTIGYTLPKGQSITFRYRVIISSETHLSPDQINRYAADFAEQYE